MIRFESVSKGYGEGEVISDVSFVVKKGELVVFIGPSGCGKTTMLRMINRLIRPSSGKIFIDERDIEGINEIELRKNIGYVIQSIGLFPHMTIRQNIEIIPRIQKQDVRKVSERSRELMHMVGLPADEYLDRYPYQLSGGQQQRIGVARAFACDPEVILMDEPFSALDPITRVQLQDELADLQAKLRKTIVFVTHDMDEAAKIADRICILKDGGIIQYDTMENIMKNPANDFVAEFVGRSRIWSSPEYLRAEDIMVKEPVCASPTTSVLRCMERMRQRMVDSVFIVDRKQDNMLLGFATATHIQRLQSEGFDTSVPIAKIMSHDFERIHPWTKAAEVLKKIKDIDRKGSTAIPVVDEGGRLQGLVTKSSLLTILSNQFQVPAAISPSTDETISGDTGGGTQL